MDVGRVDFMRELVIVVVQGADDKLGQFQVKIFRQRLITEIVCDTHWKAAHLCHGIM